MADTTIIILATLACATIITLAVIKMISLPRLTENARAKAKMYRAEREAQRVPRPPRS